MVASFALNVRVMLPCMIPYPPRELLLDSLPFSATSDLSCPGEGPVFAGKGCAAASSGRGEGGLAEGIPLADRGAADDTATCGEGCPPELVRGLLVMPTDARIVRLRREGQRPSTSSFSHAIRRRNISKYVMKAAQKQ